ncbi:hypothetical protein ACHAPJ_010712 [Fusarium lateritium]
MKIPVTPGRRERPSRAAAPKNMTEIDDSEGDSSPLSSVPIPLSSAATAIAIVDDDDKYELSSTDSVTSIPATTSKTMALAAINRDSSPTKRAFSENEGGSPTKKPRKVIIKTSSKKSTEDNDASTQTVSPVQALTPLSLQAVAPSQPPSAGVSNIHQIIHDSLISVQDHVAIALQETQVGLDLEQANKKIASLEQQLQAALSSQDSQLDLKQCKEKLHRTLQSEINLRKENDNLKRERDHVRAFNDELRIELAAEIDGKEEHFNDAFKVSDDQVEKEWRGIAFDIRNFVFQICTVEPFRIAAPREADHKEVEALKKHQKKTPELAPFCFQQYIWRRLVRHVFQAETSTWGGPVGRAFHLFCLDISKIDFEGMRELSRVKAHTADFLSKHSDAGNSNWIKHIARGMKNDLSIFMNPSDADDAGKRLWGIVRQAVELNNKLLKSRAFFLTNWMGKEYDDLDDLDIRYTRGEGDGEPVVDVKISPTLSKIGNADGRYFDQAMVICKPMVTMLKD